MAAAPPDQAQGLYDYMSETLLMRSCLEKRPRKAENVLYTKFIITLKVNSVLPML